MRPPAPGAPLQPSPAERAAAGEWPLRNVSRETEPGHGLGGGVTQLHLVCAWHGCGQSIFCFSPGVTGSFIVSPDDICARVLAHIRVSHADSVPVI